MKIDEIPAFRQWLLESGYTVEPLNGEWEVLRWAQDNPNTPKPIIYRNKRDELTINSAGMPAIRRWREGQDNREIGAWDAEVIDEDGIFKNWTKMKEDYAKLQEMPDGKLSDWLKKPWDMHHWVDMFKESCEHAPYLMGYIYAVYVPLSVVLIVWGWVD